MDYSDKEVMPPEPKWPAIEEAMPPEWMPPDEVMPPEYASSTPQEAMPLEPGWGPPPDPDPIRSCINRILDGARLKNVPSDLKRYGLWYDLHEAMSHYKTIVNLRKNTARKVSQLKQLERCLLLVQSEKWPIWFPFAGPCGSDWCSSMLAEIKDGWHPELKGGNPINWLVGHRLPEIFKEHLKRQASIKPNGPYVRFAMAFLTEFKIAKRNGKSYESSTIRDKLKLARNGHIRRKGHRVHQPTAPQTTAPQPHITDTFETITERLDKLKIEAEFIIGKGAATTKDEADRACDLYETLDKIEKTGTVLCDTEKAPYQQKPDPVAPDDDDAPPF
jgi:hypothetical protein